MEAGNFVGIWAEADQPSANEARNPRRYNALIIRVDITPTAFPSPWPPKGFSHPTIAAVREEVDAANSDGKFFHRGAIPAPYEEDSSRPGRSSEHASILQREGIDWTI
jgi:hypothetical protein